MTNSEHPRYAGDVIFLKNGVAIIANQAINREKIDRASVFSALFTPKVVTNDLLQDASVDSRVIKANSVAFTRLQTVAEGTFLGRLPSTGTGDLVPIPIEAVKTSLNYVSNQILFDTSSADLATNSIYAVISALDARIDGIEATGIDLTADYNWTGLHTFTKNVAINAALTTTGTVNGRNLATDGSKLDGIEPSATADMSAAEILAALLTVDGVTSGLDSQYLAGQAASHYLDWANTTNKPDLSITVNLTGAVSGSGSHTFTDLAAGSLDIVTTLNNTGELLDPIVLGALLVRAAATQDGVRLQGRAGGSSSYNVTLTPTTLSASHTLTLPNQSGTVAVLTDIPTQTRLRGTTGGTYTGGDLTLLAGTGISVSQSTTDYTIGNTGVTQLTGTTNRITVSASTGSITLNTPQDMHTGASPTFAGATFSGDVALGGNKITGLGTPTASTDAATKGYVDAAVSGLEPHPACAAATTGTLASITGGSVTYDNGASGVGATLTLGVALTTLDGFALTNGDRILVKNEATAANNGIYVRTSSTVLTRATDFDAPSEIVGGDYTFVTNGTLYNSTGWVNTDNVVTVGTTAVTWVQFSGAGTYTAGAGLTLTGSQFAHADTSSVSNVNSDNSGNTVIQDIALTFDTYGHVTAATVATATIVVNNGILSASAGTAGATNTTVALNFSGAYSANESADRTINPVVGPALTALASTMTGAGTGFLRKNGADTYSLDTNTYLTSAGAVTSFSAGTTGLTPSTGTVGAITLAGTLNIANGGTGATTASAARTALGATTVGANIFTLTNPSAITFLRINADNSVTARAAADFRGDIGAGTVTSVASGTGLTGGPITSTGTLALTGQALALHNLASNGLIVRTGSDTVAARTLTAGTAISITNGDGVAGNPTIDCTFTETDTLAAVTGRGANTTTTIGLHNGAGLALAADTSTDTLTNAIAASLSTISLTSVDTWAIATYRACKYLVQITQSTNYQVSEILVIHNGTTTTMTEYAVLETNGPLCTFTSDINGGNVRLLATMGSASAATIRIHKTVIAV